MIKWNDMEDNIIKSEDVAPKKTTKTATKIKKVSDNNIIVAEAAPGKKFVFFSSGSSYTTKDGHRFTREKRIYEIDIEEADFLLTLDNFRLPDQLELEDYYKENN
jgi:hypothetical protein